MKASSKHHFTMGIRLNAAQQQALDDIQGYARAHGLRLADSAVFRALLNVAEADFELLAALQEGRKARVSEDRTRTSIRLGRDCRERLARLTAELTTLDDAAEFSANDVLMAMVMRFPADEETLGILRVEQGRQRSVEVE